MEITPQWLAGFIDGEGCITVSRPKRGSRRSHYTPAVVITNTHLPTLMKIQNSFGGTLHQKGNATKNWNTGWALHWCGSNKVKQILEVVRPYLVTKADEAAFMLDVWLPRTRGINGKKVTPDELTNRELLTAQLSSFKRHNYPTPDISYIN